MASVTAAPVQSPDDALAALKAGSQRYYRNERIAIIPNAEARAELAKGQQPFAAILSCSDSRVPLELIFDQGPGKLFVVRDAGNVAGVTAIASLQFAVEVLKTPLVLVMGHESCGAVKAAQGTEQDKAGLTPELRELLKLIEPATKEKHSLEQDTIDNVRIQVESLKKNPVIAKAILDKRIQVVGAYFDIADGRVRWLD